MLVGVRELKQNASAVVSAAVQGEPVTISVRGKPVAQLAALPASRLDQLLASGRARAPKLDITQVPAPPAGASICGSVLSARADERW